MLYKLMAIPLLPIFFYQGKKLKKTMPRLPEATGERTGAIGLGKKLKLLIIGDSAAAGVGTDIQKNALSGQLTKLLKKDYEITWKLIAKSGVRVKDSIKYLNFNDFEDENYDIIIISLGVNDVLSPIGAKEWIKNVDDLIHTLKYKFKSKLILFTNVPPMGEFIALPQPLRWYLGSRANEFNLLLDKLFKNTDDVYNFSINFKDAKSALAVDGFHPSKEGCKLWAEAIVEKIKSYYTP